ncbi:MAG: hypothetical protein L0H59_19450, partial [Tomitella sp.]|nr:hypothetical protein [Tomitella sp.]
DTAHNPHGVRATLAGAADLQRGWGRAQETWTVSGELAGYGAEAPWFSLGDKDPLEYVLEESIVTDYALVHALRGDRHGNLVFNKATRQFSPPAAMAGRICIAQVEELVEPGEIDPDAVHLPGVFVHRVVEVGTNIEKRIEKRTVRATEGADS